MCSLILLFMQCCLMIRFRHQGAKLLYICILRIMGKTLTRMNCSNRKRAGTPTGDPVLF